ncbi:MAG: hypothetical protein R3B06_17370 [Kofleriaceae bacterium]
MARASVGEFLERFVLPLVTGGEVHVGRPITPAQLDGLRAELDGASVATVAVDEARADVLATVCARPPALVFGDDELALAAGLHNALVLAHPEADGLLVTDRIRRKVAAAALGMVSQPIVSDRTRVLARHGLLHGLHRLSRRDVRVSWWTGKARFLGQPIPPRLTAWRSVRRVTEDVSRAGFDELLGTPDVAPVTAALLRRTPLTQLVAPPASGPPLHWEDAVFLLRDAELARAIAYAAVGDGGLAAVARLAAAFEQLVERTPAPADVRAVAAFLVHLAALPLVGGDGDQPGPVAAALAATTRPRGLVTFAALPSALAVVDPSLAAPPGLTDEPAWQRRWDLDRAAVGTALGDATIAGVADRLIRHLGPGRPSAT